MFELLRHAPLEFVQVGLGRFDLAGVADTDVEDGILVERGGVAKGDERL